MLLCVCDSSRRLPACASWFRPTPYVVLGSHYWLFDSWSNPLVATSILFSIRVGHFWICLFFDVRPPHRLSLSFTRSCSLSCVLSLMLLTLSIHVIVCRCLCLFAHALLFSSSISLTCYLLHCDLLFHRIWFLLWLGETSMVFICYLVSRWTAWVVLSLGSDLDETLSVQ